MGTLVRHLDHAGTPSRGPVGIKSGHAESVLRWRGPDVAPVTAWQTVYPALLLDQPRARAYLVQDHEPEFYATSVDSQVAPDHREGLFVIVASPWLRDFIRDPYGVHESASSSAWTCRPTTPSRYRARTQTAVFNSAR